MYSCSQIYKCSEGDGLKKKIKALWKETAQHRFSLCSSYIKWNKEHEANAVFKKKKKENCNY